MHRHITSAYVAAAAALALTAAGVTAASASVSGASGSGPRATRAVRVSSARTSHAAASPGAELWVKRYNGHGTDDASSVAVSPSGKRVFVTGRSQGTAGSYDYATVAYNAATGAQLWVKRYDGPGSIDEASSVAVSPSGKAVFVTGQSFGASGGVEYATVAYNAATGAQLWVKRYDDGLGGHGQSEAVEVAASPSGKTVFVTGTSLSTTAGNDYATIAYNSATGAQRWVKRYNGVGNGGNYAHSLAVSASGSTVFVTGYSLGTNNGYDYATVAYNAATGAQRWAKRYNGASNGELGASSVAVSPNGKTVFVTGSSYGGSTPNYDYATVAYNAATGAQRWVKRYHGTASGDDRAYSVVVSPSGKSVFVTGSSEGAAGTFDYATVAYNAATGAQLWVKRYSGAGKVGEAYSVAVSPSGKTVYVTGSSWKCVCGGLEYATIAYKTATGAQLWVKRYGSPGGGGVAVSMVVSRPAGTVFVTGYSIFAVTGFDYVTIAYKG